MKKGMVSLPDMMAVSGWFDKNKMKVKVKVTLEGDKLVVSDDGEDIQKVLLMKFCIALRKGSLQ